MISNHTADNRFDESGAFTMDEIAAFNRRHDSQYGYVMNGKAYTNFTRIPGYHPAPPGFNKDCGMATWKLDEIVWTWINRDLGL